MSAFLIGENAGPPFDRSFFNSSFPTLVDVGRAKSGRVTLCLNDGTTFDLCEIVELTESYMVARGYHEVSGTCELGVDILPYGLIYRIELGPKDDETRVGFKPAPLPVPAITRVRKKK